MKSFDPPLSLIWYVKYKSRGIVVNKVSNMYVFKWLVKNDAKHVFTSTLIDYYRIWQS
jgi:hypothetical protein